MIKEDYVGYETAKLLKEKGFEGRMHTFYTEEGTEMESAYVVPSNFFPIYRPTLQMAMKWLREEHKIEIRVIYDNDKLCWYGACNPMNEPSQILLGSGRKCKSYEEAAEAGIRYCLERLD